MDLGLAESVCLVTGSTGYDASIPYWEPAYRDSAIVADAALGEGDHDLSQYIDSAGATAAALVRHGEQLKGLVTDFNTFAGSLARENGNLEAAALESGEVAAKTAFLVHRSHLETDHQLLSGCREDLLRKVDGTWKIARRTIVLDANVLLDKNLSVFL